MKLIKCHIENYGMFSNKDYLFSDFNEFNLPNGEGKSTLISFITAMFYGLDGNSKSKFTERKHYSPFNNGLFGGNLIVEKDNKQYRIERFFSRLKQSEDTLKIYENNTLIDISDVGNFLFHVDKESFLRTALFTNEDLEFSPTGNIVSLLRKDLTSISENDLKTSLDKIDEAMKEFKSRGNKGKINNLSLEREDVINKINNLKIIKSSLNTKYSLLENLSKKEQSFNEQINQYNLLNAKKEAIENAKSKMQEINKLTDEINNINKTYPSLPSEEEFKQIKTLSDEIYDLEKQLYYSTFDKEEELQNLENEFSDKIDFSLIKEDVDEEHLVSSQLKNLNERKIAIQNSDEEKKFRIIDNSQNINELYEKLKDQSATKALKVIKNRKPVIIFLLPILILLSCVGIIICFLMNLTPYNYVFIACAAILLLTFIVILSLNKSKNSEVTFYDGHYDEKERMLKEALKRQGYDYDDTLYAYASFCRDYQLHLENKTELAKLNTEIESLETQKRELDKTLEFFFSKHFSNGKDYLSLYYQLTSRYEKYLSYSQEKIRIEKERNNLSEKLDNLKLERKKLLDNHQLIYDQEILNSAEKAKERIDYLNAELSTKKEDLDIFLNEKGITLDEKIDCPDIVVIQQEFNNISHEKLILANEISDYEQQLDNLPYLENLNRELKEKIEKSEHTYQLLGITKDYLIKSDNTLKEKYLLPLRQNFDSFIELFKESFKTKLIIDNDFNVLFEKNGELHPFNHLSQGQRCALSLCFRLSLSRQIYGNEFVLLLDDPFVSLDQKNFEESKKIITSLKDLQILYFTCHDSRSIKQK